MLTVKMVCDVIICLSYRYKINCIFGFVAHPRTVTCVIFAIRGNRGTVCLSIDRTNTELKKLRQLNGKALRRA